MKLFAPVILIAICIGAYFMYIDPMVNQVKALDMKLGEYNRVLQKSKDIKAKREAVQAQYESLSETDTARLSKIIPDKFNQEVFANDINFMVSKYGMKIKDFKVSRSSPQNPEQAIGEVKSDTYVTSSVSFTVSGQYDQFLKLLGDVESSLQLLDVSSLSVRSSTGNKLGDDQMSFTLSMNTYSIR